jgi:hypothetical protein
MRKGTNCHPRQSLSLPSGFSATKEMFAVNLVTIVALQAFLMSGQVEVGALHRRQGGSGHTARVSNVLRGLLDANPDFSKRQGGTCPLGFFLCPDGQSLPIDIFFVIDNNANHRLRMLS